MSYLPPYTYTGAMPVVSSVAYTLPTISEARFNATNNQMEAWNGQTWVRISDGRALTPQELVEQCADRITADLDEDNPTIQDAVKPWEEATEKLQVILALADKNK